MTEESDQRGQLIISERLHDRQRTTQARSQLYKLIASFRKSAEKSDDFKTRTMYEFAAEILSGLARAFKRLEDHHDAQGQNHQDG